MNTQQTSPLEALIANQVAQMGKNLSKDLNTQASQLFKALEKDLNTTLQQYIQQAIADSLGTSIASPSGSGSASPLNSTGNIAAFSNIASTAIAGFLTSGPETRSRTSETGRSQDEQSKFRTSRSQTMSDAAATLNHGAKNS